MAKQWDVEVLILTQTVNLTGAHFTDAEMEMWLERLTDAYHHDTYGSAA